MRFYIWTVGCQMNVADSERMATALRSMGGTPTNRVQEADVVVLNTCSVRKAAEDRAIGKLNALRDLKQRRPEAVIALAGCMVGADSLPDLAKRLPFVDAFIAPADVTALREAVRALAPAGALLAGNGMEALGSPPHDGPEIAYGPVGWVPVINGCNRSCSYCIVPARRGQERSRSLDDIEAEVRAMVEQGIREVRLLGQIVDRYGRDLPGQPDLADLFSRLNTVDGLWRIRFLTSHPRDLHKRVIDAIADQPKVCEDINLPCQSGDDAILKSMRRGYTVAFYRRLIDQLRARVPGLALSTDVIVGYPGETTAQFQRTIDLLSEIRFDVVHVAMYSARPGTIAASLPDDIPPATKKERLEHVEQVQTAIATGKNAQLIDKTVEVLVTGRRKGKWEGRTRTNKPVFFADDTENWSGNLALVTITHTGPWSVSGSLVSPCKAT